MFFVLNFDEYDYKPGFRLPNLRNQLERKSICQDFFLTILILKKSLNIDFPGKIRKSENKRGVSFSVLF
jgi:hypothetical protein